MTINYKPTERDRMESNPEMHPRRVSEFTKVVGDLCAQHEIDIHQLAERLAMDPAELLQIVNGKLMPTDAVLSGLAEALDSDLRNLRRLAEKINPGR
jgi:transcriptional regulator with XRE-family HTH domain